jgi:acyl carrier protein
LSNNIDLDYEALPELPALDAQAFATTAEYEPPQGEIEEELALIWSETLKISPIGRNDSFFEMGGDSLLATTILHKIQDVFYVELPLRTIFELQTIKALAEEIDNIYTGAIGEAMDEGTI